ncbi:iron-sulfur cluster assembly protein [Pseudonocardia hispaniensis]|uniref:Iron-sulfur cluster assembly protein n=1 Tax=Pseudonocardia hispaniensis TaxID=904933 RepID=A0ABW1IZF7_9PSEU
MTAAAGVSQRTVREVAWRALGTVRDPELDEPITDLGFVRELSLFETEQGGPDSGVRVRLRLPTYFCAPNFAYLMVADAHDVLRELPGVAAVDVALEDHFAAEEINAGVAAKAGFTGSFPGEATAELDELRRTFQQKAHLACLDRVYRHLVEQGWKIDGLSQVRLRDVPESAGRAGLLRRRRDLGLSTDPDDALVVDDEGRPVAPAEVTRRLRFAKAVRVSVEGNSAFCRGLLTTRYGAGTGETGPLGDQGEQE